jgi:hypothetical protein
MTSEVIGCEKLLMIPLKIDPNELLPSNVNESIKIQRCDPKGHYQIPKY